MMSFGVALVDIARDGHLVGRASARRGKTYPVEILTPGEVRGSATQCSTTSSSGIRHRALVVLLYRTGLRISEALALRPKDVNLEIGSVVVLHGKRDRMRTVGIDPGADPHIEAWLVRRGSLGLPADAPLFCTMKGTPMATSSVSALFHKPAHRAGIEKRVHPHGFRHTHAYEFERRRNDRDRSPISNVTAIPIADKGRDGVIVGPPPVVGQSEPSPTSWPSHLDGSASTGQTVGMKDISRSGWVLGIMGAVLAVVGVVAWASSPLH